MRLPRPARYRWSGPIYDAVSLERILYRPARVTGIDLLRLHPGQSVLDIGCGTGLNFPLLEARVGLTGLVVGVDSSAGMLAQARRRTRRAGWHNVVLLHIDAADLNPLAVRQLTEKNRGVEAIVATYALSVIPRWQRAWARARAAAAPGARIAVVDLGMPTGHAAVFAPLARLACAAGGADPHRNPGPVAVSQAIDRTRIRRLGGHVVVHAGTLPGTPTAS